MVSRKDEPVHFHESRDFDWEELRVRFEPMLRAQEEEAAAAETAPVQIHDVEKAHTEGQIEGWERHFRRHVDAPVPFFKERRALLEEFPLLKEPGIHILEVGSGNGSSVLPVLRHNVSATVHATDPSPTAVQDTRMRVEEAGFGDRLTTELQPASTVPCSAQHGPFDVVMIHCTLSAIPGDDDRALLVASAALLRPGGAVLIRDHGLYDMRHLKDMRRGASMVDHLRTAYLRPGGMHRRYYSLENLQELAAAASLQVEENRYLCIRQHNKKKGIHMDRVYVHAVFRNGHAVESDVKPTARIEQTLPARAHTSPSETSSSLSSRPTAAAYMTAIKSCGANGQAAVKILSEVTQALGTHDMFAVSTALAVCGKGGDWKTAVELFNSLPEPDQESCHAALSVLQQTGRGAEAEALLDRIHHLNLSLRNSGGRTDVAVDLRCLNIALKASQRMLHLARSARPPKDEEEAGAGGDGEEGEGGVGGAEALRQESAGGDVEQERCKGSVRQERCAVSRRALALGRRLLDSAEDRFGVCPNVESYAIVAESALVAGDFMQANALYDMATRLLSLPLSLSPSPSPSLKFSLCLVAVYIGANISCLS
jgi:methyltransferase-like protein 6